MPSLSALDSRALVDRIEIFLDNRLSDNEVKIRLGLKENYAWRVAAARGELRAATKRKELEDFVAKILYRPFDERFIFWHPSVVWRPRAKAMPHMLAGQNIALITSRMTKGETFRHAQVARNIVEVICMSPKTSNNGFIYPLYLYPGVGKAAESLFNRWAKGKDGRTPNLDSEFVEQIAAATGLGFISDGRGDPQLRRIFGPEDVLGYIYAVLHSPGYRQRYKAHLKLDFPRLPLPGGGLLFQDLVKLGQEILALHLFESSQVGKAITVYGGPRKPVVGRVGWSEGTVWLDARKTIARKGHRATRSGTIGFFGVSEEVWDFHIGGYQVCHKWLKDRKGRSAFRRRTSPTTIRSLSH